MSHRLPQEDGEKNLWDFRGPAGWNVCVALQHYRCHTIVAKAIKEVQVSDTVEFQHHHLTLPDLTPAERIFHDVTTLTCTLHYAPAIACDNQLDEIKGLRQAIQRWSHPTLPSSIEVALVLPTPPTPTQHHSIIFPMRRHALVQPHASLPRVFIPTHNADLSAPRVSSTRETYEAIAQITRSG